MIFISAVSIFTLPGIILHKDPGMRSSSLSSTGRVNVESWFSYQDLPKVHMDNWNGYLNWYHDLGYMIKNCLLTVLHVKSKIIKTLNSKENSKQKVPYQMAKVQLDNWNGYLTGIIN